MLLHHQRQLKSRALPDGLFLDDLLQEELFGPMEISGAYWLKDSGGDPRAAGELLLRPIDLAKLGQLVLQRGRWNSSQLLSESWIKAMLAPGIYEGYGLLWWRRGRPGSFSLSKKRLAHWADNGIDKATIASAQRLLGRTWSTVEEAEAALAKVLPLKMKKELTLNLAKTHR